MDFALTEDQQFIQESARTFLTDTAGPDAQRAVVESATGFDEALWATLFSGNAAPARFPAHWTHA